MTKRRLPALTPMTRNFRHACYIVGVFRVSRLHFIRGLATIVAAITAVSAVCATAQERRASNMGDVQTHFADCFRPPHDAAGLLITFYFSMTRAGQVYGRPRVVLLGFNGSPERRRLFVADFLEVFSGCLPFRLMRSWLERFLGRSISFSSTFELRARKVLRLFCGLMEAMGAPFCMA